MIYTYCSLVPLKEGWRVPHSFTGRLRARSCLQAALYILHRTSHGPYKLDLGVPRSRAIGYFRAAPCAAKGSTRLDTRPGGSGQRAARALA